ncbi:MAG: hypothetical protein J0G94_01920 [Sphingomonadales bacterium]|nr:hypothetical protein [Sphingomonadales bacterium]
MTDAKQELDSVRLSIASCLYELQETHKIEQGAFKRSLERLIRLEILKEHLLSDMTRTAVPRGGGIDQSPGVRPALQAFAGHLLNGAMRMFDADCGDLQIFDSKLGGPKMLAQRHFSSEIIAEFSLVEPTHGTYRAADLLDADAMEATGAGSNEPFRQPLHLIRKLGAQSCPLRNADGEEFGMISVQTRRAHKFDDQPPGRLQDYANSISLPLLSMLRLNPDVGYAVRN